MRNYVSTLMLIILPILVFTSLYLSFFNGNNNFVDKINTSNYNRIAETRTLG